MRNNLRILRERNINTFKKLHDNKNTISFVLIEQLEAMQKSNEELEQDLRITK